MRVCDVCKQRLTRDDPWWSMSFSCNNASGRNKYYELCPDHKSQMHELLKLKIEEAQK